MQLCSASPGTVLDKKKSDRFLETHPLGYYWDIVRTSTIQRLEQLKIIK